MQRLERERRPVDLAALKLRVPQMTDCAEVLDAPFVLWDAEGLAMVYLHLGAEPAERASLDAIAAILAELPFDKNARTDGLPTQSVIFGYRPRVAIRNDFCGATALAMRAPAQHAVIARGAAVVAQHYATQHPTLYAQHLALTREHVLPTYVLPDGPFTSGIINRNNPLKYHWDTGNYRGVWSGQLVFRDGVDGGYLAFPEYDLAVACADRSLLLFDGQRTLHGVTPLHLRRPVALRHSLVYYSLREMWNCLPIGAELTRIRERRTAIEQRHAADGMARTAGRTRDQ